MNARPRNHSILIALIACLTLPLTATADVCRVDVDTPALVTVEAAAGITFDSTPARGAVVLEASPTHLVIAASRPAALLFDSAAGCELRVDVTRAEVRQRLTRSGSGILAPASATSFYPLALATKEEDHEIDPDPDSTAQGGPSRPLLTLIHLGRAIPTKEEDHDSVAGRPFGATYPDPDLRADCGLPTKEEDHEIDPDPDLRGDVDLCAWGRDWIAAEALVRQLGPGWYFVVRGGEVTQEILIEPRS